MERLGILFHWNKSRSENRSLLPPREVKPWNCIFAPFKCEQQETKDTTPCWIVIQWISQQAKRRTTPCCSKDGPRSKIHPLSSKVIRRRNSHPPQRNEIEYKCQKEDSSSWKQLRSNLCCQQINIQNNEESLSNSKATHCCSNHSKWRIKLSILDIWPKNTCTFKTHTQNLKSLITSPSSWRWFQSSNSMFRDFLEDMEILKNMDAKDLNEYRELLLKEPLTHDRLQHYPKIVLRVFVYLLRNQKPPNSFRKKFLIQLCTQWICKNKNYFCIFEKQTNKFLENRCKNIPYLNTKSHSKYLKNLKRWTSLKDKQYNHYFLDNLQSSNDSCKELSQLVSDSKTIKLVDESMLEEEKQLVCNNEDEKCDAWVNNEDVQSSNIFERLQESFCLCFTCSNDDAFCYGCMCIICKENGGIRDSLSWMKCKNCLHISHLKCAIRVGFVGFNSIRKLDGEYWCQSCEKKEDLAPYWESILQEASQCNHISRLELLLYCAMSILKDTERSKYKDLQMLVCEAWGLIANDAQCSDIQILIDIICSKFKNDSNSNYAQERNLQMHSKNYFKKAEEDIVGVQETIKEVEAWKNILFQTEEQLKRLKIKLEIKTKNAILSNTAARIAEKSLQGQCDELVKLKDMSLLAEEVPPTLQ